MDGEKGCRNVVCRIKATTIVLANVSELKMPIKLKEVSIFQKSKVQHSGSFGLQHFASEAYLTMGTSCKTKKPCLVVTSIAEGMVEWVYLFSLNNIATIQYRLEEVYFED